MEKLVNLTPHDINVVTDRGLHTIPKSGKVARVAQVSTMCDIMDDTGIVLLVQELQDVVDLPTQRPDTLLVVSAMVRTALPGRLDLVSPGDLIRDDTGNPVGCKGLITNRGLPSRFNRG